MKLPSAAFFLLLSAKMGNVFAATCGGGNPGDGICSGGLCCSEWGWCGTSGVHCSGSNPTPTPPSPSPPSSTGAYCGCSTCSQTVWDTFAGDYTCGARITWLQNAQGYEENEACTSVTSEFPDMCRCNPSCDGNPPTPTPPSPSPPSSTGAYCGCSTCSQPVWDAFAGDYTCGARITWLQNAQGYEEDEACSSVTSEFPDICRCNPSCDGNPPTPTPPSPTPGSGTCGNGNPGNGACADGTCCSEFGWCGTSSEHCTGPTPPTPTPPTPTPPTGNPPVAGGDSRVIAYAGNWQTCPTAEQTDGYTHIVVAFAVSYTWSPSQNICDAQCNIQNTVPICNNVNNQALVDSWRAQGKKVILSFGGAAMGGSWAGNTNNCWDYCFGREDQVSTALVNIVQNQNFDGIDLDYEYCYDTASRRHAGCTQVTGAYSDTAAQNFLSTITSLLRQKMDALGDGYELTHAPMDVDLVPDSPYYQILKAQHANLNFLMPQFYNGITRPASDGFNGSRSGQVSAMSVYGNIANDIFRGQPDKVVFGFCIDDCSATGSNASGSQAVEVLKQIKAYNGGEYACNGGGFFWVALDDIGGSWSDLVSKEVAKTAGCVA